MLSNLKNVFLRSWQGRRSLQPFWERLYQLSLTGLNIGTGSRPGESGELWVLDQLKRSLPDTRPAVIFDIGANVGDYAAEVLTRFKQLELYCFEPSAKTFEMLSRNLARDPRSKLFNIGLGAIEEIADLYSDAETSGLASVHNRRLEHLNIQFRPVERVSIRTLDSFCREQAIRHIDLAKLDVEGHELKVIQGGQQFIASKSIDFVQFEFGGTNIDSRTFFRDFYYLLEPHYRIYRILKDGLAPVRGYSERCEIFMLANFLCVSKEWVDELGPAGSPLSV